LQYAIRNPKEQTVAQPNAWHPDNIEWQEIGADGTKYALLEGDRNTEGELFTYAFFIPAGFWDPAHWHTQDARVAVMQGKLYLGYGHEHSEADLKAYPAGSYVLVPANARHFDGSLEDTLIIGTAGGRWATHYVNPDHQASAGTPKDAI
jgi:quercetin dioxygenase-like cupin family protein